MAGKRYRTSEIDYSCPSIDSVIADVEKVRKINDQLRDLGIDLEDEIDALKLEIADKDKEIDALKNVIDGLKDEISVLEMEQAA